MCPNCWFLVRHIGYYWLWLDIIRHLCADKLFSSVKRFTLEPKFWKCLEERYETKNFTFMQMTKIQRQLLIYIDYRYIIFMTFKSSKDGSICVLVVMNAMKTCPSVTFCFMKNSFSDISRKWILPDMIRAVNKSQFTPKMKANAVSRLLSSLVWIDQYKEFNSTHTLIIFGKIHFLLISENEFFMK